MKWRVDHTKSHEQWGNCGGKKWFCVHIYFSRWQTWACSVLLLSPVTVQLVTLLGICGNQWLKWPEMKNHFPTLFQYLLSSTLGQGMELSATWIQNKCQHWLGQFRMAVWTKGQSGSIVGGGKKRTRGAEILLISNVLYLYIHQNWDLQGWATAVIMIGLIRRNFNYLKEV